MKQLDVNVSPTAFFFINLTLMKTMYSRSGAQRSSHKPRRTDGRTEGDAQELIVHEHRWAEKLLCKANTEMLLRAS